MKAPLSPIGRLRSVRAFSLMELLLAVSIMTLIVASLATVFHHTQRALRNNLTQVDVLESGRAAMDLLMRDLSQMTVSDVAGGTNLVCFLSTNYPRLVEKRLVYQAVVGGGVRTNVLDNLFFLSRSNRAWVGTGYRVAMASNGVGSLVRFSVLTNFSLTNKFYNRPPGSNELGYLTRLVLRQSELSTNYLTVADGVMHLRLRAFDGSGLPMTWQNAGWFTQFYKDPVTRTNQPMYPGLLLGTNVFLIPDLDPTETWYAFLSNALPASLELELGILEAKARDQYQALAAGSVMAQRFLSNRASQVHLFRQRIPLRESVLYQAYHP